MRYYFNVVWPEGSIKDEEGSEFLQDSAALTEAELIAREMIAHYVLDGSRFDINTTIEVIKGAGECIECVALQSFIERKLWKI